jgi:hypothetical protein
VVNLIHRGLPDGKSGAAGREENGDQRPGRLLSRSAKRIHEGLEENGMTNATTLVRFSVLAAVLAALAAIALATSSQALASPPDRPTIWVDGERYNAIVPLSPHGPVQFRNVPDAAAPSVANLETTDDLYMVASNTVTPLVSDAAPGDRDYNGGRWLPHMVTPIGAGPGGELTSEEEIMAAADAGLVTISAPGDVFLCPITSKVRM